MAVKTFTDNTSLPASDINTYLNNGGLVYITSATATSGTIVGINNCFSATYDNYFVTISGFSTSGAAGGTTLKLRASGTPSSTNYYYSGLFNQYGVSTLQYETGANAASYAVGAVGDIGIHGGAKIDIFTPALAQRTSIMSHGVDPRTAGAGPRVYSGYHNANTAYDGFEIISSATIASMTIRVYGYRQA